ncbi:MAG: hypothetical protein LUD69_08745, partial [Oscillospiraceae bacterium]|nr:hypothetical protein [Oscillospiraceae bacterium]
GQLCWPGDGFSVALVQNHCQTPQAHLISVSLDKCAHAPTKILYQRIVKKQGESCKIKKNLHHLLSEVANSGRFLARLHFQN